MKAEISCMEEWLVKRGKYPWKPRYFEEDNSSQVLAQEKKVCKDYNQEFKPKGNKEDPIFSWAPWNRLYAFQKNTKQLQNDNQVFKRKSCKEKTLKVAELINQLVNYIPEQGCRIADLKGQLERKGARTEKAAENRISCRTSFLTLHKRISRIAMQEVVKGWLKEQESNAEDLKTQFPRREKGAELEERDMETDRKETTITPREDLGAPP